MLTIADFNYDLPDELIAQHPVDPRHSSRMLVMDRAAGTVSHRLFTDLLEHVKPGDLLVANDTRVIPARLIGVRSDTGGKVEVFLLHRRSYDEWEVLVKPGKRVRPGRSIRFSDQLECEVLSDTDFGGRCVRFIFDGIFESILDELGETPLPPYIKEKLVDQERYQTVYANQRGSSAAPTAGLHFTEELMDKVRLLGAEFAFVTLHIGLGTFRPVRVENIKEHQMHREYYSVPEEAAIKVNKAKSEGRRVIAVGTTAVRTLETATVRGILQSGSGWTDIFIYPGYKFRVVDALITNFHLPESTLLMLVSALAGREEVLQAYRAAVIEKYRFFSFGDAMLIY